jgi:hypothetical protein
LTKSTLDFKKSKTPQKEEGELNYDLENNQKIPKIFSSPMNGMNGYQKKPMNFDIEMSYLNNNDFFELFENHFLPENILNEKSTKWKFKAMNLKKKIESLKSLVLVIRSQYNEFRKSYDELNIISKTKEKYFVESNVTDKLLKKFRNKKIFIKFTNTKQSNREKNCFMKINFKGLYIYQKFLCFEEFLIHISFDSILKIFYLKQHLLVNSRKQEQRNGNLENIKLVYKIQFKKISDRIECIHLFKTLIS